MSERNLGQSPQLLPKLSQPNLDRVVNTITNKEIKDTLTKILMPQLGESVTEGTIGMWLKETNEKLDKYDPLVEVETDKVNTEIPSPIAGILRSILVETGITVPVGTEICEIEEYGDKSEKEDLRDYGSPKPHPAIMEDTDTSTETKSYQSPQQPQSPIISTRRIEAPAVHIRESEDQPGALRQEMPIYPGDTVISLTPMRRAIAEHMVRSERIAPHVTTMVETDMTGVVAYRSANKEEFFKKEGVEFTYLPFAIKSATLALKEHPDLNAVFDEDRIIHRKAINIGIAVALKDGGLIVPVIKDADRLNITGLAHSVAELVSRANAGTLTPDDVTGGTFTVNNTGALGSIISTPIIVQPQVAILTTEKIVKRPIVVTDREKEEDMIAIRSMMNMCMSIDHRALDGAQASGFLQQVKGWLESVNENSQLD